MNEIGFLMNYKDLQKLFTPEIKELLEILRVLQKSSMGLYYITDVIKIMNTKNLLVVQKNFTMNIFRLF